MVLTILVCMDKIHKNPGALGVEETRQSIPNLAVKLCYGDNTAGGALWENSLVPGLSFRQNIIFTRQNRLSVSAQVSNTPSFLLLCGIKM
jgi:hypothetical protein